MFNIFRKKTKFDILEDLKKEMEKTKWYELMLKDWILDNKYKNISIQNYKKEIKISGKYDQIFQKYLRKKIIEKNITIEETDFMGVLIYKINNKFYTTDGIFSPIELAFFELNMNNK